MNSYNKTKKMTWWHFTRWFLFVISVVCAAACLIGFIVVSPQVDTMFQLSKEAYLDYYINEYSYIIRGTDENMDFIADATEAMEPDFMTYATEATEKTDWVTVEEKLNKVLEKELLSDIDIHQQNIIQEAEWLYTISQMRQGNFFRAKRLLHKISDENGSYSGAAYRILESL